MHVASYTFLVTHKQAVNHALRFFQNLVVNFLKIKGMVIHVSQFAKTRNDPTNQLFQCKALLIFVQNNTFLVF